MSNFHGYPISWEELFSGFSDEGLALLEKMAKLIEQMIVELDLMVMKQAFEGTPVVSIRNDMVIFCSGESFIGVPEGTSVSAFPDSWVMTEEILSRNGIWAFDDDGTWQPAFGVVGFPNGQAVIGIDLNVNETQMLAIWIHELAHFESRSEDEAGRSIAEIELPPRRRELQVLKRIQEQNLWDQPEKLAVIIEDVESAIRSYEERLDGQ